jgi:hypothetical protein
MECHNHKVLFECDLCDCLLKNDDSCYCYYFSFAFKVLPFIFFFIFKRFIRIFSKKIKDCF